MKHTLVNEFQQQQ